MTQNGLKHILKMFLKSVTKTALLTPLGVTNVTLFLKASLKMEIQNEFLLQLERFREFQLNEII